MKSTSSRAFCTVSWLYTLAPSSGTTARSSSLLREKSCAPVSTPRQDTVLRDRIHNRHQPSQVSQWFQVFFSFFVFFFFCFYTKVLVQ